jgi:hypothetical protein
MWRGHQKQAQAEIKAGSVRKTYTVMISKELTSFFQIFILVRPKHLSYEKSLMLLARDSSPKTQRERNKKKV